MGSRLRPSRLDAGVQTPLLDRMPAAAPSNLDQRKSLFRDMQVVGAGGITDEMKGRAKSLGINDRQFGNGMRKLASAPASIARSDAPMAKPVAPAVGGAPAMLAKPTAPAVAPAPLAGKAKARADMARYGVTGAAERAIADVRTTQANDSALAQSGSKSRMPSSSDPSTVSTRTYGAADMASYGRSKSSPSVASPMATSIQPPKASVPSAPPSVGPSTVPSSVPKPSVSSAAPAAAKAPNPGLAMSIFNDVNKVGEWQKGNRRAVGRAMVAAGDQTTKEINSAVDVADRVSKGSVARGAAFMTAAPKLLQKAIPGQTGEAIRNMQIPQKIESTMNRAGEAVRGAVMGNIRKGTRIRESAWNAVTGR